MGNDKISKFQQLCKTLYSELRSSDHLFGPIKTGTLNAVACIKTEISMNRHLYIVPEKRWTQI